MQEKTLKSTEDLIKGLELFPGEESKITSPWQLVIKDFEDKINPDRISAGYKPYPASAIASKLKMSGIRGERNARIFYLQCEKANNFVAFFEWYLKNNRLDYYKKENILKRKETKRLKKEIAKYTKV